jgi:hypothetical protein
VRGVHQRDEVVDGPVLGRDLVEVADVVATVAARGVVERGQPQAVDAQPLVIVQFGDQAGQVTVPVPVGVVAGLHEHFVEDRAPVPLRFHRHPPGVPRVLGA